MDKLTSDNNFIKLNKTLYDIDRLLQDIHAAEKKHNFLRKACIGWESIPLRSVDGIEGKIGNLGGGVNNSADPSVYKDTTVMEVCPYIKEIMQSMGTDVFKVRIMKLIRRKKIATHVDNFSDPDIIRFHIPIVTDDKVRFIVENDDKNLEAGNLYWVNVRKQHKVENWSKTLDRIHLVFDVRRNANIEKMFVENSEIL